MKILKIENGIGYFYSFKTNDYKEINTIDRDSLLAIIEKIMEEEHCSKDDFQEDLIDNKAQKIVYKDLDEKIGDLLKNRQSIIEEIDSRYKAAFEEYSSFSTANLESKDNESNE